MEMKEALLEYGLDENESVVYLALIELGSSLASDIALKAKINRVSAYDILERLIKKGLVSYNIQSGKKHYQPSNPEELLKKIQSKEKAIKEALPDLISIFSKKTEFFPKVETFYGKEGFQTVLNEMLNSESKEILSFGGSRSTLEDFPAFMVSWHKQRAKRKILLKAIWNDTQETRKRMKDYKETMKFHQHRLLPFEYQIPTLTVINDDKLYLFVLSKEPLIVQVKEENISKNYKQFFEQLWKQAKP
jgi:HTH-type transcriptional regulator, sugar sensing transcriptional regulator